MSNSNKQKHLIFDQTTMEQKFPFFTGIVYHFLDLGVLSVDHKPTEYATIYEPTSTGGFIDRSNPPNPPDHDGKEFVVLFWYDADSLATSDHSLSIYFPEQWGGIVNVYCVCCEKCIIPPPPSQNTCVGVWAIVPSTTEPTLIYWDQLDTTTDDRIYDAQSKLTLVTCTVRLIIVSIYSSPKWWSSDLQQIFPDTSVPSRLKAKARAQGNAVCSYKLEETFSFPKDIWKNEWEWPPQGWPLVIHGKQDEAFRKNVAKLRQEFIDIVENSKSSHKKTPVEGTSISKQSIKRGKRRR
jgi:hypothetical protein